MMLFNAIRVPLQQNFAQSFSPWSVSGGGLTFWSVFHDGPISGRVSLSMCINDSIHAQGILL